MIAGLKFMISIPRWEDRLREINVCSSHKVETYHVYSLNKPRKAAGKLVQCVSVYVTS